jgi:DNA invertase Pin-like site-specific DNA recombinase
MSITPTPVTLFVRVSNSSQNYDRQVSDLTRVAKRRGWTVTHIIHEKGSATKRKLAARPELQELLVLTASGQIKKVLVTEFSRLGRLRGETPMVMQQITEHGVSIYADNIGMETLLDNGRINPATAMVMAVMNEMYAQETERNSERIISGQQEAKKKGKHIGRPAGSTKTDQALLDQYPGVVKDLRDGLSIRRIAAFRDVAKSTVEKVKAVLDQQIKLDALATL